jgi:hypothetical protein
VGRIDRLVLRIIGGVTFLLIAGLALAYANDWWLSGVMTASILGWLAAVLAALYSPPERRPGRVGAVVLGLLYVTLALGPWFRGQVGPWLVTSQALAYVETKLLGRQPQPSLQQQIATSYPVLLDTGVVANTSYITTSTGSSALWTMVNGSVPVPVASRFVEIGHWLCGWLAAAIGAVAAAWMSRRTKALTSGQGAPPSGADVQPRGQGVPPTTPTNGRGFGESP